MTTQDSSSTTRADIPTNNSMEAQEAMRKIFQEDPRANSMTGQGKGATRRTDLPTRFSIRKRARILKLSESRTKSNHWRKELKMRHRLSPRKQIQMGARRATQDRDLSRDHRRDQTRD